MTNGMRVSLSTNKRTKSWRVGSEVDRISALHDDLLCLILSFLPTKMVVRTCALSTRWRYLYNLVSSINIRIVDRRCSLPLSNFVERYLLFSRNRQSIIQRFHLKCRRKYINHSQIIRWIDCLICHNVREFRLCIERRRGIVQLPARLFSCETLVVLQLSFGGLTRESLGVEIPAETCLPKLKVLHMWESTLFGDHIEKLLKNCPVLDDLCLNLCQLITSGDSYKLNISNATLKSLILHLTAVPSQVDKAFQIVVNSPALVYLGYSIIDNQSFMLLAKQSLAKVAIGGYWSKEFGRGYENANYAKAQEHDVLKGINNIHTLIIQQLALHGLYSHEFDLPLFNRLKDLTIFDFMFIFDARCLKYLLARCVVLETLIFKESEPRLEIRSWAEGLSFPLEQSPLTGVWCHLKKFEVMLFKIVDSEAEALMKLIEFFLNNAKVLEKLSVLVRDLQFPLTKQADMVRELLNTSPRVSEKCQVFFGEWTRTRKR